MDWIKVTPETMPPDMQEVFATIEYQDGKKIALPNCRYNKNCGWEWGNKDEFECWRDIRGKVTHWMPYPEPAED